MDEQTELLETPDPLGCQLNLSMANKIWLKPGHNQQENKVSTCLLDNISNYWLVKGQKSFFEQIFLHNVIKQQSYSWRFFFSFLITLTLFKNFNHRFRNQYNTLSWVPFPIFPNPIKLEWDLFASFVEVTRVTTIGYKISKTWVWILSMFVCFVSNVEKFEHAQPEGNWFCYLPGSVAQCADWDFVVVLMSVGVVMVWWWCGDGVVMGCQMKCGISKGEKRQYRFDPALRHKSARRTIYCVN